MPKLKTNSAAKKRFKKTAKGKIKFKRAGLRHLLYQESSKLKRPKRKKVVLNKVNQKAVERLLPYS